MPLSFFRRKVDPAVREEVLAFYREATLVTAYQDRESGKYNAILGNHIATLDSEASMMTVMEAALALGEADKEAIRRLDNLNVPDLAGKDWAAWRALYLKHLEWVEASYAAFEAFRRAGTLPQGRVESLTQEMQSHRELAEKASGELLRAVGASANDLSGIMRDTHEFLDASQPGIPEAGRPSMAREIIQYLQTQAAFQQLTLEIYNDGLTQAGVQLPGGNEVTQRGQGSMVSPANVQASAIPAAERKVGIFEELIAEHQARSQEGLPDQALVAMSQHSKYLEVASARAKLQLRCLKDWVMGDDADFEQRISSLDDKEVSAMDADIQELNELIRQTGIDQSEWSEINRQSFNVVRQTLGLPPLSQADFASMFLEGVSGGRPRFFL